MRSISCPRTVLVGLCAALVAVAVATALAANSAHVQQLKDTGNCPGCDLTDAAIGGVFLQGADLSGANLSNADLYGSNLRGANLTGAVFNGTNLRLANLAEAVGADLSGALTDERTTCPDGNAGPCN